MGHYLLWDLINVGEFKEHPTVYQNAQEILQVSIIISTLDRIFSTRKINSPNLLKITVQG